MSRDKIYARNVVVTWIFIWSLIWIILYVANTPTAIVIAMTVGGVLGPIFVVAGVMVADILESKSKQDDC